MGTDLNGVLRCRRDNNDLREFICCRGDGRLVFLDFDVLSSVLLLLLLLLPIRKSCGQSLAAAASLTRLYLGSQEESPRTLLLSNTCLHAPSTQPTLRLTFRLPCQLITRFTIMF